MAATTRFMEGRLSLTLTPADNAWSAFLDDVSKYFGDSYLLESEPHSIVLKSQRGSLFDLILPRIRPKWPRIPVRSSIGTVDEFNWRLVGQFALARLGYRYFPELQAEGRYVDIAATAAGGRTDLPNVCFNVAFMEQRGKALIAREVIPRLTVMLCEKPFLVHKIHCFEEGLQEKFHALSNDQKQQFLSLYNAHAGDMEQSINAFSGIYYTNYLPFRNGKHAGLFATICLINHDCNPNSCFYWDPVLEQGVIRAVREIKPGEEITISYVDITQPSSYRRSQLKERFNFRCFCQDCHATLSHVKRKDSARSLIKLIEEDIASNRNARAQLLQVWSLFNCNYGLFSELRNEAIDLQLRLRYLPLARELCVQLGEHDKLMSFSNKLVKLRRELFGEDHPVTIEAEELHVRDLSSNYSSDES